MEELMGYVPKEELWNLVIYGKVWGWGFSTGALQTMDF